MFNKFFEYFPTPRFLKFSYVGLDIDTESLHYAELITKDDSFRLGRYGREVFEKNDNLLSNESLKNALRRIREKDGITHVKVSLPEEETFLYTTPVQGETDQEIKDYIAFHLEENVPVLGIEALFDYYLLSEVEGKKIAVVSVVTREVVNRYTSLLEECGLTAVSFMVESGAISRAVVKKGMSETCLLVYLSREKTMLAIVHGGFVQFGSTSGFGGATLTSAIQQQFGVDVVEARKIKYKDGLYKNDGDGEMFSSTLANAISVLRDEVQKVNSFWLKQPQGIESPVKKIILCGKDAAIPGFVEYLSSSMRIPVEISDVWTNISYYDDVVPPISFEESLSYATSLGLVLSSKF